MFRGIYWQPVIWFVLALLVRCNYTNEIKHPFSGQTLHIINNLHILRRRGAEPEPSSEPLAEGTPEPESVSKAPVTEGNIESESEPEASMPNSTTEPESEPEDWPEPGPRWQEAYQIWKWGWELHVYGFATIFLLMGLYAGYYVAFNIHDGLDQKYLSVSLNVMVLIFGLTRAFVLYFDPYHQGHMINALMFMRLVWSIGSPCLLAADSLVILALVETAKLSLAPPRVQRPASISVVITLHFLFVLLSDTIVSMYVQAKIMLLFCQIFFVVWGSVLGVGYFVLGYKLDKKLFGQKLVKTKEDKMYIYLIYVSGVANFVICAIMIYSATDVFGVYSDTKFVAAWPWYAFQTISRASEITSCVLVFTVSAKRTRVKKAIEESKVWRPGISTNCEQFNTTTLKRNLTRTFFARFKTNRINVSVSPAPGISQTNSYSGSPPLQNARKRMNFLICSRRSGSITPILDKYNETDEGSGGQSADISIVALHSEPPSRSRSAGRKNTFDNRNATELPSAKLSVHNKSAAKIVKSEASSRGKGVSNPVFDSCENKISSNKHTGFQHGLSRQMSMFSVLQENKMEANSIPDDAELNSEIMPTKNRSTFKHDRVRRMSMFSALQENKMNAEIIANDFQTKALSKKNNLDAIEEF